MRRYAFIDVQNIESTTEQSCGFAIDLKKLYDWLHDQKWSCDKIFFYTGIEIGNQEKANEFDSLSKLPCCMVRSKAIQAYKKPDKKVSVNCIKCGESNIAVVDMGYRKKANCDVDLTMDILENATTDPEVELLIFTGDGDFEPVIKKAASIVKKIYIVSNSKLFGKAGLMQGHFSTKLHNLLDEKKIFFIDIDSWKYKIKKDLS
jgi:uncharacterized LabA/DUF88 family protein